MTTQRLDAPFAASRQYPGDPRAVAFDLATLPFQISNVLLGIPPLSVPSFGPGAAATPNGAYPIPVPVPVPIAGPAPAPAPAPAPVSYPVQETGGFDPVTYTPPPAPEPVTGPITYPVQETGGFDPVTYTPAPAPSWEATPVDAYEPAEAPLDTAPRFTDGTRVSGPGGVGTVNFSTLSFENGAFVYVAYVTWDSGNSTTVLESQLAPTTIPPYFFELDVAPAPAPAPEPAPAYWEYYSEPVTSPGPVVTYPVQETGGFDPVTYTPAPAPAPEPGLQTTNNSSGIPLGPGFAIGARVSGPEGLGTVLSKQIIYGTAVSYWAYRVSWDRLQGTVTEVLGVDIRPA